MATLITGLDFESTGLDWKKGHRIIEISAQVYRLEDRKKILNFTERCSNEGQRIDKKAQEVHGIAAVDLIGKPPFAKLAPKLHRILERSQAIVTHNGEWFDIPFAAHEFAMCGLEFPDVMSFDTMNAAPWAAYDDKLPSLREFCWTMGVDYDPAKAHAAEYDVDVLMEAFFVAVDQELFDISHIAAEERTAA